MLEFISEKDSTYCILDGKKMSTQELIDEMILIILQTREKREDKKN